MNAKELGQQPAFPMVEIVTNALGEQPRIQSGGGISTRTLLAGMALAGAMACQSAFDSLEDGVEHSLKAADALLAELAKEQL